MPRSRATSTRKASSGSAPACRFVGGKGGVGKTTCAAALALDAAASGRRTLLVTTDPAPSLADALRRPLGATPRVIPGTRGLLHALEIDAKTSLRRWLASRRPVLETIALRGTWLDRADVEQLLRLSLPGIDEIAALLVIAGYARGRRYDELVIDTAPTGHTLRMLATPAVLQAVAEVFDAMQARHRVVVESLRGGWNPDDADRLTAAMMEEAADTAALLRDPSRTRALLVTLPEPMAVEESADALAALDGLGVAVDTIVVNRVTPKPDRRCRWCDARRAFERRAVDELHEVLSARKLRIRMVAAQPIEPRSLRALAAVARDIRTGRHDATFDRRRSSPAARRLAGTLPAIALGGGLPAGIGRTRLVLFGGKGGVGKTTCAAAAALGIAAREPDRRVLLLSIDPAHSLGDVLRLRVSDDPTAIRGAPGNVRVRELDAVARFQAVRDRYVSAVDTLFDRLSRGSALDASYDRRIMRGLFDLTPPGIDELAAILDVTDALGSGAGDAGYDLVVMDTAPSGHALRLLETPALVHDWVKALMGILLKYQPLVGLGELGELLLRTSKGLAGLRELLSDPARTHFVAVTRPAALSRHETGRLLTRVASLGIAVPAVIVNAAGAGSCGFCDRVRRAQGRELAALRRMVASARGQLVVAPAVVPPPQGTRALATWRRTWRRAAVSSRRTP
jgi:arsenite/tail-anchored protein-transporting ATPase